MDDFNRTLDIWINDLPGKTFEQLCVKPSSKSWSLGQVYVHLIENTLYYLEQAKVCLATNDHASDEMSDHAKEMFANNQFPDMLIEGPAENATTPQPTSKEELLLGMQNLKSEANRLANLMSVSAFKGKTKHPGLLYFNASEWLQFGEMHMRHHLRQKKRIEEFLKSRLY